MASLHEASLYVDTVFYLRDCLESKTTCLHWFRLGLGQLENVEIQDNILNTYFKNIQIFPHVISIVKVILMFC